MLRHESYSRRPLGRFASVLYSKEARERGIRGCLFSQAQQVVVDAYRRTVELPKRGVLAWRSEEDDESLLDVATALCGPAAPFEPDTPAIVYYVL